MFGTGYGDTFGEEHVLLAFQQFLDCQDISEAQLKSDDKDLNDFLDFLTGQRQQSESESSGAPNSARSFCLDFCVGAL